MRDDHLVVCGNFRGSQGKFGILVPATILQSMFKQPINTIVYGISSDAKGPVAHMRRGLYGSRLFSANSGDSKNSVMLIPKPWHISWMMRSLTES